MPILVGEEEAVAASVIAYIVGRDACLMEKLRQRAVNASEACRRCNLSEQAGSRTQSFRGPHQAVRIQERRLYIGQINEGYGLLPVRHATPLRDGCHP